MFDIARIASVAIGNAAGSGIIVVSRESKMESVVIVIVLAAVSLAAGVLLRLHLTVLSLVPAMCVAATTVVAIGLARSNSIWAIALAIAVSATCLQIGYFVGRAAQRAVAAVSRRRTRRR
jgi:hypothetical protein